MNTTEKSRIHTLRVALVAALLLAGGGAAAEEIADLIIHNARITTQTGHINPPSAVAVKGGHILEVGNDDKVLSLRGPETLVVDARDRRLIPGLNDSHIHPTREAR